MAPPLKTQLGGMTEHGRQAVTVHFQINISARGAAQLERVSFKISSISGTELAVTTNERSVESKNNNGYTVRISDDEKARPQVGGL